MLLAASSLAMVLPSKMSSADSPTPAAAARNRRRAAAEQVVSSGSGDAAQPPADTVAAGAGTAAMTCGASAASDPNMILSLPGPQSVKHTLRVMPHPCNDIWVCRPGLNESLPTVPGWPGPYGNAT